MTKSTDIGFKLTTGKTAFMGINKNYIMLFFALLSINILKAQMYTAINGDVEFISNAPLEIISAKSSELQGLLNLEDKRFAFKIYIESFDGFNSRLQKIHFYENYMETSEYPTSSFSGKIIEDIIDGESNYRAKGLMNIHGEKREVIIPVSLIVGKQKILFKSNFKVRLVDYNISIPKLVYQKIAEEIDVSVSGILNRKE